WLLLTTLAASDWPATEIVRLYQARWQIELVFKRIKQLLRVQAIRAKRQQAVEATIRALVVAWALEEQIANEVRSLLPTRACDPHAPASSWLLATLGVATLRTIVRGSWTLARIRACLPLLVRLLVTSRRKRRQQESEVRAWLLERFGRAHPLAKAA
ncbi:MAG TPA: transposase, partial [Roseiflexaceae bacterium]